MHKRDAGVVLASLALGLGAGVVAAGCGEDREGSVEVEGGTTGGTTATTGTTGTGTTSTTGESTSTTSGP